MNQAKLANASKIIGYLRVSTVEQADNGHSIDAQRAAIKATSETRGWEILWVEDAASAKDLDRPGLGYALSMLSSGQAGGIVVSRLDRLSRSVHGLAILLKRARAEGWNVVMLDYGLDLSTPYGEFGATMLMAAAQLERDLISVHLSIFQDGIEQGFFTEEDLRMGFASFDVNGNGLACFKPLPGDKFALPHPFRIQDDRLDD